MKMEGMRDRSAGQRAKYDTMKVNYAKVKEQVIKLQWECGSLKEESNKVRAINTLLHKSLTAAREETEMACRHRLEKADALQECSQQLESLHWMLRLRIEGGE